MFTITGKHLEITEALKSHAEEKTSKLPRYFDGVNRVEVILEGKDGKEGGGVGVEIIARGEHRNVFVATEHGEDAYACIDAAVHKLERQLRRKKTRQRNRKHAAG